MKTEYQELEEGEELCPVCDFKGNPGECNVCEHFIGDLWDFDVRLQKNSELLESKMSELQEQVESLCEIDDFDDWVEKQTEKAKKIIESAALGERFKIEEDDRILFGEEIVTDGMLGGEGYNLYCENPQIVEIISNEISEIIDKVKGFKTIKN